MPKLCKCGKIVEGRCDKCYPQTHGRTTKQRGYDHKWRKLSERIRHVESPLCVDCEKEGIATPATEVHHEIPIKDAPWLRLEPSNLVALCHKHHEIRETKVNMGSSTR